MAVIATLQFDPDLRGIFGYRQQSSFSLRPERWLCSRFLPALKHLQHFPCAHAGNRVTGP